MADNEIQFNSVLDKIIDVTEKNLTMQSEFLRAVYELKGRFDSADRDHKDFAEDLKHVVGNSFDILNRMKAVSNEDIKKMLQDIKDRREHEGVMFTGIKEKLDAVHIRHCAADPEKIKEIADAYKLIKKIMAIMAIGVLAIQFFFSIVRGLQTDSLRDQIVKELRSTATKAIGGK